jgi:hypothetical protein
MDEESRRRARSAARSSAGDSRTIVEAAFEGLRVELDRERAGALGRAGQKLGDAIAALRAATDPATYDRLHDVAQRARWELEIVREAVGLRHHGALDDLYPMPPRRPSREPS